MNEENINLTGEILTFLVPKTHEFEKLHEYEDKDEYYKSKSKVIILAKGYLEGAFCAESHKITLNDTDDIRDLYDTFTDYNFKRVWSIDQRYETIEEMLNYKVDESILDSHIDEEDYKLTLLYYSTLHVFYNPNSTEIFENLLPNFLKYSIVDSLPSYYKDPKRKYRDPKYLQFFYDTKEYHTEFMQNVSELFDADELDFEDYDAVLLVRISKIGGR